MRGTGRRRLVRSLARMGLLDFARKTRTDKNLPLHVQPELISLRTYVSRELGLARSNLLMKNLAAGAAAQFQSHLAARVPGS